MRMSKLQFLKQELRTSIEESVNFIDVLERIYNKTRGKHNTAALITTAQQSNALIICHTKKWAKRLRKEHNVKAVVYSNPMIWNYEGPVVMDMPTMFEFVKAHSRMSNNAQHLLDFMDQKGME